MLHIPDALLLSTPDSAILVIQPVTPRAYEALKSFPASDTGAVSVHSDDFEKPNSPAAVLKREGLRLKP
jgi:hypothetical protein